MKKLLSLLALGAVVSLSTSCNTTIGFGRDLKLLGTGIGNKIQGKTWEGGEQYDSGGGENLPTY
jgi:predicted small secreted protein